MHSDLTKKLSTTYNVKTIRSVWLIHKEKVDGTVIVGKSASVTAP